MANIRAWRGSHGASANLPSLQYKSLLGQHLWVPAGFNASVGKALPVGLQLIFDLATFQEGEVCFDPFDDKRMHLRASEVAEFSGDEGYSGAYRCNVLVQHHGLASFQTTAVTVCDVIDSMWDRFVLSPEGQAGKLPVYRIEEPFAWTSRQYPGTKYKPVYSEVGWVTREASAFGPRLIPAPQPLQVVHQVLLPSVDNALFNTAETQEPPAAQPTRQKGKAPPKSQTKQQKDDDLNDLIPF
jgi:hypothetical protein